MQSAHQLQGLTEEQDVLHSQLRVTGKWIKTYTQPLKFSQFGFVCMETLAEGESPFTGSSD